MTFEKAKKRLDDFTEKMKDGINISYAAIIKNPDPNKPKDYWFEYGTSSKKNGNDFHVEKELTSGEKKEIFKNGFLIYTALTDGESIKLVNSQAYGNLLNKYQSIGDYVRPIKAGLGISDLSSFNKTGTLGILFRAKKDKSIYLLSNMHVLARYYSGRRTFHPVSHHEKIIQPSRSNSEALGLQNIKNRIAETVWKQFGDEVDVGVAKIFDKVKIANGFFNYPHEIIEDKYYKSDDYYYNDYSFKIGYKTGYTEGNIISKHASIKIKNHFNNINGKGKFIIFSNQIMTTDMAERGDSGSLLVYNDRVAIGLTFADINFDKPKEKNGIFQKGRTFHNKLETIFPLMEKGVNYNGKNHPIIFDSFITNY